MPTNVEVEMFVVKVALARSPDEMQVNQPLVARSLDIEMYPQVVVPLGIFSEGRTAPMSAGSRL